MQRGSGTNTCFNSMKRGRDTSSYFNSMKGEKDTSSCFNMKRSRCMNSFVISSLNGGKESLFGSDGASRNMSESRSHHISGSNE